MEIRTMGMVFGLFGRIPRSGESITYENLKFTVEKMKGARIVTLMLVILDSPHKEDFDARKQKVN